MYSDHGASQITFLPANVVLQPLGMLQKPGQDLGDVAVRGEHGGLLPESNSRGTALVCQERKKLLFPAVPLLKAELCPDSFCINFIFKSF